jgi:DNA-binding NtrC family response regulator
MRTLLIDDDQDFAASLAEDLRERGWGVDLRTDAESALPELFPGRYDLVLSDVRLPHADGLTVLRRVRVAAPGTPVVLLTSFSELDDVVTAMRGGAMAYLEKPLDLDQLANDVLEPLEDRSRVRAVLVALETPPSPVSAHLQDPPAVAAVRRALPSLVGTRRPVAIAGPPGSGRLSAARLFHDATRTAGEPFVVIDPASTMALLRRTGRADVTADERAAWARLARSGTLVIRDPDRLAAGARLDLLRVLEQWFLTPTGDRARVVLVGEAPLADEAWASLANRGAVSVVVRT